jgi:hypothetical protein
MLWSGLGWLEVRPGLNTPEAAPLMRPLASLEPMQRCRPAGYAEICSRGAGSQQNAQIIAASAAGVLAWVHDPGDSDQRH